jgi:hypothetical protein
MEVEMVESCLEWLEAVWNGRSCLEWLKAAWIGRKLRCLDAAENVGYRDG